MAAPGGGHPHSEVSAGCSGRIGPTGRRDFFLGLEMPSRNRMLILRVSAGSAEGSRMCRTPRSAGAHGAQERREPGDRGRTRPDRLPAPGHLRYAGSRPGRRGGAARTRAPIDPVPGAALRLAAAPRRLAPRGLTQEAQRGLWGELWILREVVAAVTGMTDAVRAWRGPLGADQDSNWGAPASR